MSVCKSRTLEIKHRVHIIKFYRNWLKFVGDDSVWLGATMCKAVWLELYVSPRKEPDPRNKTSRSGYKILSKLTEIYCRWLNMTRSYSMQSSVARITHGSHIKSRILEVKLRVHTIKFLLKLTEIYCRWLSMTRSYSVQSSVARIYTINFFWETDSYWVVTIVWLIVYYIMSWNVWVGLVCGGDGLEWCG